MARLRMLEPVAASADSSACRTGRAGRAPSRRYVMWQSFSDILDKQLIDLGSDKSVEVGRLIVSLLFLGGGLVLSSILARLAGRQLRRGRVAPGAAHAMQKLLFYALFVAVVLTALSILHVPVTMFAFLGGAIAIGIGFGAQNIINNFISGWILMIERPVRIDDLVEVEDHIGKIETIGARCTRIRRNDGIHMLVPNSVMLERTVVNWTLIDKYVRTIVSVGVAYGSPTDQVASLIRGAMDEQEAILKKPEPIVVFEDFGDNALIFDAYFWCEVGSAMELRLIRSAVRFRVDQLFREAGIVIAFPQRDTHLDTLKPLEIRLIDQNHGQ